MQYSICEGTINMLAEIVFLNQKIFQGMYEQEPYSLAHYQNKLKGLETKIFLAKDGDKIIGDSISIKSGDSLYVWVLGVLKERRNNGIATEILQKNEQFARSEKLKCVTIKVYNVSPKMLRLLLARGYQITGVAESETEIKYNAVHLRLEI